MVVRVLCRETLETGGAREMESEGNETRERERERESNRLFQSEREGETVEG